MKKQLSSKSTDEWVKEMEELEKIPCGPIFNIKQAVENPQIQERNMIVKSYHKIIGEFKSANPIKYLGCAPIEKVLEAAKKANLG